MIIDGYTAELLINRAIGGTTLEESVKALQDVFVDHDLSWKGEPMSDLISRQAAIKALADDMPQTYTPDGSHYADDDIFKAQEIYADCITRLEQLPSAEPVRHERWIYICNSSVNGLKICECTGCHRRTYGSLDFCGNCGAKMDEEATDEQIVSD